MTLDTPTVLALLDTWEANVEEILRRADEAALAGNQRRAGELLQRAYAFSQCRADLRRACPELQLPEDVSEVFQPLKLVSE